MFILGVILRRRRRDAKPKISGNIPKTRSNGERVQKKLPSLAIMKKMNSRERK